MINRIVNRYIRRLFGNEVFPGSQKYWETRYKSGDDSGSGSYGGLAKFKADILNSFVRDNNIKSVIEFGCGDGNQLSLIKCPRYIGLDVSPTAIKMCIKRFAKDNSKSFFLYDTLCFADNCKTFQADLTLSLDVIYHLIEDEIFEEYIKLLFSSASRFVVIYSSNYDSNQIYHQRDRKFTRWVNKNAHNWKFIKMIRNKFPNDPSDPCNTSKSDFYFFKKNDHF